MNAIHGHVLPATALKKDSLDYGETTKAIPLCRPEKAGLHGHREIPKSQELNRKCLFVFLDSTKSDVGQ